MKPKPQVPFRLSAGPSERACRLCADDGVSDVEHREIMRVDAFFRRMDREQKRGALMGFVQPYGLGHRLHR